MNNDDQIEFERLIEAVKDLQELSEVQDDIFIVFPDSYMQGMANGLRLAKSVFNKESNLVDFFDPPTRKERWFRFFGFIE